MKKTTDQPLSKWYLLRQVILICTTILVSTLSFAQAGDAPMQSLPNFPGPMRIDGFLQRQSAAAGDWLAGPGGATNRVFTDAGAALVPLAYRLEDRWDDLIRDDIFDGGNKLFQDPNLWGWRSQKPPAKDDIHNSMVFLALDPITSHIWLAISGDRMSTNGTSYLDFEFYQNPITKTNGETPPGAPVEGETGGFVSTGPHGGRTIGDLSITLEYTAGGSFASVYYLQWQPGSEAGTYDYFPLTVVEGTAFAAANAGVVNVPYGAFGATTYQPLQFVEGAIDLTLLIGGTGFPDQCGGLPFKSLFIKSKSSAEKTADLKDFIAPLSINPCFDRTAPTITCPPPLNLGCNPTIPPPSFVGGSASDNCGSVTPVAADGPVSSNGCARTMTRTWRVTDACGNTATCGQAVNWTADNAAPSITTGGTTTTLGCNPSAGDINAALGTATATDACSTPSLTSVDGSVGTNGCQRTQTRTWTARDACSGLTSTASRSISWTSDNTGPSITTGGTTTTLGCNPSAGDINGALGTATATDACSTPTLSSVDGSVGTNGCLRTQTRTWTARDACGNTSTAARSISWTSDMTGPTITTGGTTTTLGCNPSAGDINAALGTATATDACSTPSLTSSDGTINTTSCGRNQTRTWIARDVCGNTSSASRTVSWSLDANPPAIQAGGTTTTLGCNPSAGDINAALGTATATDACSTPSITSNDGPVGTNGCTRSQTRSWLAVDACSGLTATASRTVTWTSDNTGPTITTGGTTTTLGCNPSAGDINAALGTATATDACSTPTLSSVDGSVGTQQCLRSQTRTWTARDACGNTSTSARTVTWTSDVTGPTITTGGTTTTLGCNPVASDINAALGTATATDACSTPTLSSVDGSVGTNNCGRSQTRTWTARDACGNTSTSARTVTWTVDVTAPVFTSTPGSVDIACADPVPSSSTPTASDACGTPTVTATGSTDNPADCSTGFSRVITRSWKAQDACGNTATYTQTIRVACCPTAYCTYTQGAYGTEGGAMCDGENGGWTTLEFIGNSLTNWGGSFSVGKPGRSVIVDNAQCVIDKLPGAGAAKELVPGDVNLCNFTPLQPNGGVKNILLAQTVTLGLNLGIENTQLGGFVLQVGELATQDPLTGCGDDTPETRVCHYSLLAPYNLVSVENEYTYRTFTQEVIDAIPGANTVANLYELANRALANVDGVVGSEGGASLDAINDAVSSVNEVFDNCKIFVGWDVARCAPIDPTPGDGKVAPTTTTETLAVTAYPNPYQENFSLKVNSPVTGQASIGFYTIDGVKIGEMKRDVIANRDVWVPFNVPAVYRTRIVYTVAVGSYNAKGVVLSPN
jgi:hypothetical protein